VITELQAEGGGGLHVSAQHHIIFDDGDKNWYDLAEEGKDGSAQMVGGG